MTLHKNRVSFLGLLLLCLSCLPASGQTANGLDFETVSGLEGDEKPEIILADLATTFRKHCVKVYIHGKSHDGNLPTVGAFANDIRNERPTLVGGYWWDDKHIVIEDPVIHDRYIRNIEISLPYSDVRYQARIAGRFVKLEAMLLEVLPGEAGIMPQSFPLDFVDGDLETSVVLTYEWKHGDWGITADSGLGASVITDDGRELVKVSAKGVFISEDGLPLGLAFGERLLLDEDHPYWCGRELAYTPIFSADESVNARKRLRAQLDDAVLETRFRIRVKVDDDEEETADWMFEIDEGPTRTAQAEIRAAGLVVGDNHLLVPLQLPAEGIARIDDIVIVTTDGKEIKATFAGALRDYMAVMVQTETALPTRNLPPGFTRLNPLVLSEEAFRPDSSLPEPPVMQYIQRWRIDYALGRRRETADYDRWLATFHGYRGDPVVNTFTNEEDGSLAFDVAGNLVAVALTPRVISSQNKGSYRPYNRNQNIVVTAGFRPLGFIAERLHASDVFDPAMRPVAEDEGQRLVDLGVEFQGLDANTSRLFTASPETRGGRIGLLVNYVYPGLPADKIGIKEHDILLRLYVEGKNEPMELRTSGYSARGFMDFSDLSAQNFQQMLQFMPPPWPSRDDVVSTLLTATGVGRKIIIEYLREGELKRTETVTAYAEPDYRNAKKEKFQNLGLTVKPVTYEVQRYFRRSDSSGVIVSKVEDGGKASVAGMHHYLLITRVDGEPVKDVENFKAKVKRFENGEAASIELMVDGFGKTRLVKIE